MCILLHCQLLLWIFAEQFLGVVKDINPEMRKGGCNLLSTSQLPSFSIFHSVVCTLLTSLEHHPEVCWISPLLSLFYMYRMETCFVLMQLNVLHGALKSPLFLKRLVLDIIVEFVCMVYAAYITNSMSISRRMKTL